MEELPKSGAHSAACSSYEIMTAVRACIVLRSHELTNTAGNRQAAPGSTCQIPIAPILEARIALVSPEQYTEARGAGAFVYVTQYATCLWLRPQEASHCVV